MACVAHRGPSSLIFPQVDPSETTSERLDTIRYDWGEKLRLRCESKAAAERTRLLPPRHEPSLAACKHACAARSQLDVVSRRVFLRTAGTLSDRCAATAECDAVTWAPINLCGMRTALRAALSAAHCTHHAWGRGGPGTAADKGGGRGAGDGVGEIEAAVYLLERVRTTSDCVLAGSPQAAIARLLPRPRWHTKLPGDHAALIRGTAQAKPFVFQACGTESEALTEIAMHIVSRRLLLRTASTFYEGVGHGDRTRRMGQDQAGEEAVRGPQGGRGVGHVRRDCGLLRISARFTDGGGRFSDSYNGVDVQFPWESVPNKVRPSPSYLVRSSPNPLLTLPNPLLPSPTMDGVITCSLLFLLVSCSVL